MAKAKWPKLPSYLVPLFQCATIYLCRSKQEYIDAMKAIGCSADGISLNNGLCRHFVNDSSSENFYIVGVFDGKLSTLVHECAHATFFCCSDAGVDIDASKANETYCYILDRMFTHFAPFLQESQNGKANSSKTQEDSKI
jgi:hypothetical protein